MHHLQFFAKRCLVPVMLCVGLAPSQAIEIQLTHNTSDVSSSFLANAFIERAEEAADYVEEVIYGYDDPTINDNSVLQVEIIYLQSGQNNFFASAGGERYATSDAGKRYTIEGNIQVNIDNEVVKPMMIHEIIHLMGFSGTEFEREGLLQLVLKEGTSNQYDAVRYIGENGVAGFHEEYWTSFNSTDFPEFTDPTTGKLYIDLTTNIASPGSHLETDLTSISGDGAVITRKPGVEYSWRDSLMQASYDASRANPELNAAEKGILQDLGFTLALDEDADGLIDAWEVDTFGALETVRGEDDSDGDGLSNAGEYVAKTNPLDPLDLLKITAARGKGDGSMDLSWPTRQGCTYVVRLSTDLVTWYDLRRDLVGDGQVMTQNVRNTFFPDAETYFFRVEIQ